jgi:hypothetical protein
MLFCLLLWKQYYYLYRCPNKQFKMEKDIEFYKKQEQALTAQLNAVRAYIKAFFPSEPEQALDDAVPRAKQQNVVQSKLFMQIQQDARKINDVTARKIPIPEKVYKALEAVGEGKTADVADKMTYLYVEYKSNPKKALKDARHYISKLKGEKRIDVVAEGKGSEGSTYRVIQSA